MVSSHPHRCGALPAWVIHISLCLIAAVARSLLSSPRMFMASHCTQFQEQALLLLRHQSRLHSLALIAHPVVERSMLVREVSCLLHMRLQGKEISLPVLLILGRFCSISLCCTHIRIFHFSYRVTKVGFSERMAKQKLTTFFS